MNTIFRNFYRNFYMRTGGFMPTAPLNQLVFPGDFFQIRNGEMIVFGNIYRSGLVDPAECLLDYGQKLNPVNWSFSDGLSKPYSGRSSGSSPMTGEFEFSKQVLSFDNRGAFFFRGNEPEAVRILNWNDLQQMLIIKFTQTVYSFRELYVVTECATTSDWTLAVAGADKAELEVATDSDNFGLVEIFGHHSAKTIQSKDIEYHHRQAGRKPSFFRAKKLAVQDEQMQVFISQLIAEQLNKNEWAGSFFEYDFHYDISYTPSINNGSQAGLLDMLQANQLNPTTALLYFKWVDANLDDIEKFFISYGY